MGWYQDYAGNWFNEYDHDGIEYEDGPSDKVPLSDKETPLKKTKKNVSFEKADTQKEKKASKSEKSPRERWQWAFSRIVQVSWFTPQKQDISKEKEVPKTEQDPFCLPRPADYDDYWYEAEDGLWYNEYDANLEEGQYYEEVPEEDGYPKPDLSEIV